MAINFQYNKTSLQDVQKQLKIRQQALPTLKSKEAALRLEVKKAKKAAEDIRAKIDRAKREVDIMNRLWVEFPDIIELGDVKMSVRKLAGTKIPALDTVEFVIKPYSLFNLPGWVHGGIEIVKKITSLHIEYQLAMKTVEVLGYARKKTTQKVNLYEKVQIPGYEEAIRKIKRFLEDVDNLSKAAQKIVKTKMARQEAEGVAA